MDLAQGNAPEQVKFARSAPIQARYERQKSFDPSDFSFPKNTDPAWRYAPLEKLAFLKDSSSYAPMPYKIKANKGFEVGCLSQGEEPRGSALIPEDLPAAIAHAYSDKSVCFVIPDGVLDALCEVDFAPTLSLAENPDSGCSSTQQRQNGSVVQKQVSESHCYADTVVIVAGKASSGTIVLRHTGCAKYCQNVEIIVQEGANLNCVSFQEWDKEAIHLASHFARVEAGGFLQHTVLTFGRGVVRVNPSVSLCGRKADSVLNGLCLALDEAYFEENVFVDHASLNTKTDVNYKCILAGKGARNAWVGDVAIRKDAVGTDSYEKNQNLILHPGARADSVPNLEIECGDIEGAGHASATGRFDEEHIFYLMARGIPKPVAKRMIIEGFAMEIIQKLPDEFVVEISEKFESLLSAAVSG